MARTVLTPGKLYARMAAEFRRMRPEHCGNCRMPLVVLTHRVGPGACNWTVEPGPLCDKCRPLVAVIATEAAARFDINDPVSDPYFPLPSPPQVPHLGTRR